MEVASDTLEIIAQPPLGGLTRLTIEAPYLKPIVRGCQTWLSQTG
jgi:hypothetical protein